jgi:Domain of unknown function (DUF222)
MSAVPRGSGPQDAVAPGHRALRPDGLRRWIDALADTPTDVDDATRVELLGLLEALKGAAAAAQARISVDFAASQEAQRIAEGVPRDKSAAGIGAQVALARRESPSRGSRHLGLARALVDEMPHTLGALSAGRITEWTATLVVKATACLSTDGRRRVDEALADRLGTMSDRRTAKAADALAYELDPAAFVARGRKAVTDRRVTVRPAPDVMSYLTAYLPVAEGVACLASLDRDAKAVRSAGDPRSLDQIRADLLVERLTGVNPAVQGMPVEVNLVMTDTTLFGGATTAARLAGYGPLPGQLGRDLACHGTTRPELAGRPLGPDAGPVSRAEAWVRRLFTDPVDDSVTRRDPRRRLFTGALRDLLIARDQVCRTPYCDAPVRHADHVRPFALVQQTTAENGEGLCEACNYAKESAGWSHRVVVLPDSTRIVRITTPTGHTYDTAPPPVLDSLGPVGPQRRPLDDLGGDEPAGNDPGGDDPDEPP